LDKKDGDARSHIVLWISDDADIAYTDLNALAADFIAYPTVSVLMPTPYGAKSGILGPKGMHLGDLRANPSPPLLYLGWELGPVWVADLDLLCFLEPPQLTQLGESYSHKRCFLPPASDAFSYHFDLQQPVLTRNNATFSCNDIDAFLIRQAVAERYPFSIRPAANRETVVFVVPFGISEDRWESDWGSKIINQANALRSHGCRVVFVEDCKDTGAAVIGGFTPAPFFEIPNSGGNLGAGWIFAVNAEAVRAAHALSYLTGFRVVNLTRQDEYLEYTDSNREKYELARLANESESISIKPEESFFTAKAPLKAASFLASLQKSYDERQKTIAAKRGKQGVTIVLPIYCALDAVITCIRSLLKYCPADYQIVLVNDASDAGTTSWLRNLAAKHDRITLVELEENRGFIEACYAGLQIASKENDILLLNSDIVLTEGCFELVQDAAYSSPSVGLASPLSTGSPHLQIDLNPGDSLEQAAKCIRTLHRPQHPTIITPEGQFLYIRRWALDKFGFFDRVYGRGFCEESDMCMRMFLHGVDMVCADNALIFHRRSASFSSETRSKHYRANRPIFDSRWGTYYRKIYQDFRSRDVVAGVKRAYRSLGAVLQGPEGPYALEELEKRIENVGLIDSSRSSNALRTEVLRDAEVVFILTSVIRGGGALSVLQHVNELTMRGIKAKVISLKEPKMFDYPLLTGEIVVSVDQLFELDWSNQKVVGTYWFTAYLVKELTRRYPKLDGYFYIQDYEPWFYARPFRFRAVQRAEQSYELGLKGVAKTEFLQKMVKDRHGVDVELITPGLARSVFYPGEQETYKGRPRFTALFRSRTPRRGFRELVELIRELKQRVPELEVRLFGDSEGGPEDLDDSVEMLGGLTPAGVAKLYRNSDILVDMSYWHGFGRMGIESMACGVVPVLSRSGGVDRYAEDGKNSFLFDVGDHTTAVERIVRLAKDREFRLNMRQEALLTATRFSEAKAVNDWLGVWGLQDPALSGIQLSEPGLVGAGSQNVKSPSNGSQSATAAALCPEEISPRQ